MSVSSSIITECVLIIHSNSIRKQVSKQLCVLVLFMYHTKIILMPLSIQVITANARQDRHD